MQEMMINIKRKNGIEGWSFIEKASMVLDGSKVLINSAKPISESKAIKRYIKYFFRLFMN